MSGKIKMYTRKSGAIFNKRLIFNDILTILLYLSAGFTYFEVCDENCNSESESKTTKVFEEETIVTKT